MQTNFLNIFDAKDQCNYCNKKGSCTHNWNEDDFCRDYNYKSEITNDCGVYINSVEYEFKIKLLRADIETARDHEGKFRYGCGCMTSNSGFGFAPSIHHESYDTELEAIQKAKVEILQFLEEKNCKPLIKLVKEFKNSLELDL